MLCFYRSRIQFFFQARLNFALEINVSAFLKRSADSFLDAHTHRSRLQHWISADYYIGNSDKIYIRLSAHLPEPFNPRPFLSHAHTHLTVWVKGFDWICACLIRGITASMLSCIICAGKKLWIIFAEPVKGFIDYARCLMSLNVCKGVSGKLDILIIFTIYFGRKYTFQL